MKMIEDRTRKGTRKLITFKKQKQTTEKNYLNILNGVGCESDIGKLKDEKPQIVNLDTRICMNQATMAHELVHALGFDHEHNRPDRDDWVDINFNNVIDVNSNSNFQKLNQTQFRDFGTSYDYESIMHYHSYAHTRNNSSTTIRAKKAPFEIVLNQNLSEIDVQEIRKLYNCKAGTLKIFQLFPLKINLTSFFTSF